MENIAVPGTVILVVLLTGRMPNIAVAYMPALGLVTLEYGHTMELNMEYLLIVRVVLKVIMTHLS